MIYFKNTFKKLITKKYYNYKTKKYLKKKILIKNFKYIVATRINI